MLNRPEQNILLETARKSIDHGLSKNERLVLDVAAHPESLQIKRASFVTLKIAGQLRGCIGQTTPLYPLVTSVCENAYSSAFCDPRFKPLTDEEFRNIHLSISVLTPVRPLEFTSEPELIEKLESGIDGLIIEKGHQRATFLPAVWESLPDAREFLQHLKHKAGLAKDEMPEKAWHYQSYTIEEEMP